MSGINQNNETPTTPATPATYDIWLGVRLSVEAKNSEKAEQKAGEWLQNALNNGRADMGVKASAPPLNLIHTAVRLLNQQGEDARRLERERHAERLIDSVD